MQQSDSAQFKVLLEGVMSYYRQETTDFILSIWYEACKGYELEQVAKALTAHATDPDRGQFAPKVADIIRQLSGTTTEKAAMAWGKVFDAMQRVGAYTDVVFDDPAIHAAVRDCGGWPKMCRTETEELSYLQHRFAEAYRAYVSRKEFNYPKMLIGDRSPDNKYLERGLPGPLPVPIGDVAKARLVYKTGGKQLSGNAVELLELSVE
jgi:hypothetical protein